MAQVTNWNKAEAECRASIKRLAEMPCPTCEGEGQLSDYRACLCHGTGALFPWLREKCSRCHGDAVKPDAFGTGTVRCVLCDGRGWVPNYGIRLETVLAELVTGYEWNLHHDAGTYYVGLHGSSWCTSHGPDLWLVLWQTVEKAVSK